MRGDQCDAGTDAPAIPLIEILAETPGTIAEIRVADAGRTASVIYTLPDPPAVERASARGGKPSLAASVARLRSDRDLAQQRRVSAHTLARIDALLADTAAATTETGSPAPSRSHPGTLAPDLLRGAEEIAAFLYGSGRERRKVYHLVETARLPHFRLGNLVRARRTTLMAWIEDQESRGRPGARTAPGR